MLQRRLIIFGIIFLAAVLADGVKFILIGGPNIVNWNSFIHPAWVFATLVLFFAGALVAKPNFWQLLFWIQLLVVVAALANQYMPYWDVLTYHCMLFNLVFTAMYFLLGTQESPTEI